ncbi:GNAT family N-acetyltransferase, partial [Streptomyces albogriseolus]|uniref:GNAT family N-acetyltransferase n=1 Tax=Streptomyces albogriseolus TaxID=1887 RepID=UPI00345FC290
MSPEATVRVAEDPADREACFAVRKEVFVAEQGVPEDIEYDADDADAVHLLAVAADGTPLGTARPLHGAAAAAKNGGDPSVGSLGRLAVLRRQINAAASVGIRVDLDAAQRGEAGQSRGL